MAVSQSLKPQGFHAGRFQPALTRSVSCHDETHIKPGRTRSDGAVEEEVPSKRGWTGLYG